MPSSKTAPQWTKDKIEEAFRRFVMEHGRLPRARELNPKYGLPQRRAFDAAFGMSPYQYAMRSSNLGFAGRGVIKETTGIDIEPHYHSAYKALARGHIQGVWDRREARANLKQVLLTMGGRNLYYR